MNTKWNKTHPEKMRIASKKWRDSHRNQFLAIMRDSSKNRYLNSRYKITEKEWKNILERQYFKCLGCQNHLVLKRTKGCKHACVDHNHTTGKVRGILCEACNWTLGRVKENTETLRRLIAYLNYDRTKVLIYLIGALKNKKIVGIANFFRKQGYDVFEDWNYVGPNCDDEWQKHEQKRGRTYFEALKGRAAENVFLFDKAYLDLADIGILLCPGGKSAFMELGYLKGQGKPVFILLPKKTLKRYEVMTKFATGVYETKEEILNALNSYNWKEHYHANFRVCL